jgi:hypothetical protein
MRGRLIFPFLAELRRLDTAAIAAGPPGYDDDFKEPAMLDVGEQLGDRARREFAPVLVPCQVEPETFEAFDMQPAGQAPSSRLRLVFHFTDLERLELVDGATGHSLIRVGDRLAALCDREGSIVQATRTPPGLYVVEARPLGFGLGAARPRRNLLLATFEETAIAAPRGALS